MARAISELNDVALWAVSNSYGEIFDCCVLYLSKLQGIPSHDLNFSSSLRERIRFFNLINASSDLNMTNQSLFESLIKIFDEIHKIHLEDLENYGIDPWVWMHIRQKILHHICASILLRHLGIIEYDENNLQLMQNGGPGIIDKHLLREEIEQTMKTFKFYDDDEPVEFKHAKVEEFEENFYKDSEGFSKFFKILDGRSKRSPLSLSKLGILLKGMRIHSFCNELIVYIRDVQNKLFETPELKLKFPSEITVNAQSLTKNHDCAGSINELREQDWTEHMANTSGPYSAVKASIKSPNVNLTSSLMKTRVSLVGNNNVTVVNGSDHSQDLIQESFPDQIPVTGNTLTPVTKLKNVRDQFQAKNALKDPLTLIDTIHSFIKDDLIEREATVSDTLKKRKVELPDITVTGTPEKLSPPSKKSKMPKHFKIKKRNKTVDNDLESNEIDENVSPNRLQDKTNIEAEDIGEEDDFAASSTISKNLIEINNNIPDRVDFPQSLVNASPAPSNGNEMRNTKKRHRWTFDEEEALISGLNAYGGPGDWAGHWAKIRMDPRFGDILRNRTNVQMKDKFRTFLQKNEIFEADGELVRNQSV